MSPQIALATEFAFIVVTAAIVSFLAKQTGQPTIVAYIVAGLLLGPAVFGVVTPGELTEAMAELGLAFLLFLLGIKLQLSAIKDILRPIVRISIPQMALVCLTGAVTTMALGFPLWESVLIGLAVMYSSTAVVVKTLTDKDEATSLPGKIDIGVLLVQDIVVVVLLALLAAGRPDSVVDVGLTLGLILLLLSLIALAAVVASRYLLPVVFKRIAEDREAFLLLAIAWAFLFVFVAETLALSVEIGAFVAGLAIAQLPYSTELQDRVTPLTNLFILIFFVSVGLQLEAAALVVYWQEAIIAAIVLMVTKFWIFFLLIDNQDFSLETTFLASVNMIQISEFALVVGAAAVAGGFIGEPVLGFLSLVALCTMSISVYVISYNHQLYERLSPFFRRWERETDRDVDERAHTDHAVVIGYDAVTRNVIPLLAAYFDDIVIIDRTVDHVTALSEAGYTAIYGDFRHAVIRKKAGLTRASFVLSSTAAVDANKALLGDVGPETTVFVEAEWTGDALELYDHGADYVILSPQLAAERLATYLTWYFEDRSRFTTALDRDIELLADPTQGSDLPLHSQHREESDAWSVDRSGGTSDE